jgi:hypothetical protein
MPVLQPNKPVDSAEPRLLVQNPLSPGRHRFSLVVVDDSGRASAPAEWVVTVQAPLPVQPVQPVQPRPPRPQPPLRPVRPPVPR